MLLMKRIESKLYFRLSELIKTSGGSSPLWIGLHDRRDEDNFVWLDEDITVIKLFVHGNFALIFA